MEISKLDAARRQLDTAIELHFEDGDAIAVHTLAAAAYEIITTLRRGRGLSSGLEVWIVPERRDEFRALWKRPQNFFKHADRDPDATLRLIPAHTEVCLYEACVAYGSLHRETEAMTAFKIWFGVQHSELLADPQAKATVSALRPRWVGMPRREFRQLIGEAARHSARG